MFILNLYSISWLISVIICDNIDTQFPITFSYRRSDPNAGLNTNGSHFGYSMVANQLTDDNIVLVGAPKLESRLYRGVQRSGAIFRCQLSKNIDTKAVICKEIDFGPVDRFRPSKDMHLGSSLTTNNNFFFGCAHLWVSLFSSQQTPVGKCFQISNQGRVVQPFGPNPTNLNPLTTERRPLDNHLMAGFSSVAPFTESSILVGAPGYYDFSGSIIKYLSNGGTEKMELDKVLDRSDSKLPNINSYLGYSITTGFFDGNIEYVVMGAPRFDKFRGKVLIYPLNEDLSPSARNNFRENLVEFKGRNDGFGENFGASVLSLDINNDKLDDLVVGAPLYSPDDKNIENGRVYVFLNNKDGNQFYFLRPVVIVGQTNHGRFGSALAQIDVNLDEFRDVIISSPFETNADGSLGAVYLYMGSQKGLSAKPEKRISAEIMPKLVLNGFGISLVSNIDFDSNGYPDILIGSYLSENAVLLRTKPMATLTITDITFKPNKIRLSEKNCPLSKQEQGGSDGQTKKNCFHVGYCVKYEGKHIRDKQSASVVLEITDSKLRVREQRFLSQWNNRSDEKTIELKANQRNCFSSFPVYMIDKVPYDIITGVEVKLTVELKNETRTEFCKDCAVANSHITFGTIDFEHGCHTQVCSSRLTLSAVSKYNDQKIEGNLIEGLHDTIDIEISVTNSHETAINTKLIIQMSPVLLELTNSGDADQCRPMANISSYECDFNKVLPKDAKDKLTLHFIVARLTSNSLQIQFKVKTDSNVESNSKVSDSMRFEIIRKANLMLLSEQSNSFSYSDKIPRVVFSAAYTLVKSGPSSVEFASLVIRLPTNVIIPTGISDSQCRSVVTGFYGAFPIVNKTLELNCDKRPHYCTEYRCRLPKFNSGAYSQPYILSLALIPSTIKALDFNGINFKLNSELKIDDKIKYENEIKSSASMTVFMARDSPIMDAKVEPWVLFVSSGFGVFILIITVCVLIKMGFFRRKKLEEIEKVKLRMSMRPDMYDLNVLEMDEQELNAKH